MWKIRHREVKLLTPDHTARKWQSWDLNIGGRGKLWEHVYRDTLGVTITKM